ncbi:hypothetical protein HPY28_04785 [Brevibacillus sp. HB1.2]|uniref:hypothetical protein n=1 Tax=Brevibacillus TaxID=55080 RepID=UPI00156BD4D2|nr:MULTISPECIES: hypothetical protein [unclassified Brevibacillus]NRS15641.1 hypothetical protein [Brevibacillus sp. HB1.4B]NTU19632.1 hypothetical protein [Brevibacillus sp. HB1.2]
MELTYQIEEMELSNGIKTLCIGFPVGYESLSDLFSSEISVHSAKWYLDAIDRVVSGSSNFEQFRGNACRLEIFSEKTNVINYLFESIEDNHLYSFKCSISTMFLKKLIDEWVEELERFESKNK